MQLPPVMGPHAVDIDLVGDMVMAKGRADHGHARLQIMVAHMLPCGKWG
jgi:hypothetical protein